MLLRIKDVVRPYFALKHYAEYYLRLQEGSKGWSDLEQATLTEFKKTTEELRSLGESVAINQISWREIE